jgi:hypothetical protein
MIIACGGGCVRWTCWLPLSRVSCLPARAFSSAAAAPAAAAQPLDVPAADGVERPSARVNKIVDDIMQLNIFESIQLSKALQVRSAGSADIDASADADESRGASRRI